MGESRNRTGTAYALTTFAPILPGHTEDVRAVIEGLPRGAHAPIARLKQVHLSRIQIFDHLVYQGAPQKPDKLQNDYLVFTAVFDGELDAFLDDLMRYLPEEADSWWRHCVGYPGLSDGGAFRAWIRQVQRHTSLFAVASPGVTVQEVLGALDLRERVAEFAIAAQGLSAAELQQSFLQNFPEAR